MLSDGMISDKHCSVKVAFQRYLTAKNIAGLPNFSRQKAFSTHRLA